MLYYCNRIDFLPGDAELFQGKGKYMDQTLRIALLQILPTGTTEGNLEKGISCCRRAKELGADIALFPEMWSDGYEIPEDIGELKSRSVSADGAFAEAFGKLAAELDMAIAVTILEKHEPLPRNTVILFDRHGNKKYSYAKVHTCDFGDESRLDAGDEFFVANLDTRIGNVKIGSMICYDREFSESARILMLKGAEVLLVPNACPMEINRLSQLRGRSFENMLAIATCNYPEGKPDCNGHSSVFDGVAYLPELPSSRDICLLEADGREDIFIAELDMARLRSYRENEVHGNAYRRPEMYGILTEQRVEEPFIRADKKKRVNFYDEAEDALLQFAVIIARSEGKWVFCKHKDRDTWEVPGGHREPKEAILDTAKRELYEETGALEFDLSPVCVYSVIAPDNFDGAESFGMLYYADIHRFERELHSEIEKIVVTDELPERWTYPTIQPELLKEAGRRGFLPGE